MTKCVLNYKETHLPEKSMYRWSTSLEKKTPTNNQQGYTIVIHCDMGKYDWQFMIRQEIYQICANYCIFQDTHWCLFFKICFEIVLNSFSVKPYNKFISRWNAEYFRQRNLNDSDFFLYCSCSVKWKMICNIIVCIAKFEYIFLFCYLFVDSIVTLIIVFGYCGSGIE